MLESQCEIEHTNALVGKVADSPTCWISGYIRELERTLLAYRKTKRNVQCTVYGIALKPPI